MLTLVLLGGEARAWGDLGHKVICEIAFRLVQPNTQAAINRLMQLDGEFKTFSDACIYPDHPRIRASEHFLNLPRDSRGLTYDACPLADACVLTAILSDFKTLQAKENTDASKLVALKSLGHWVGDIHQPLHVSFLDDKGGNTIRTSGQCPGNLHAVWDTCLVRYAVGPDASEAVADLLAVITPEMKAKWNASVPRDWANESFAITEAARTMYCVMRGSSCDVTSGAINVSAHYLDANEPVVKTQLQKAGVRLARLLDTALQN
ncbi:S1/P1 nuclease [Tardiphaga sp. 619_E2_N8_5]|uniref:S1/P1 nuclease n=1 Tax=unclassified Tardiphaga TaxID=2631404 RepID=UPI003F20352F